MAKFIILVGLILGAAAQQQFQQFPQTPSGSTPAAGQQGVSQLSGNQVGQGQSGGQFRQPQGSNQSPGQFSGITSCQCPNFGFRPQVGQTFPQLQQDGPSNFAGQQNQGTFSGQSQQRPNQTQQGQLFPGQTQQGQLFPGQTQQGQFGQTQQSQLPTNQTQQGQLRPGQTPSGQQVFGQGVSGNFGQNPTGFGQQQPGPGGFYQNQQGNFPRPVNNQQNGFAYPQGVANDGFHTTKTITTRFG